MNAAMTTTTTGLSTGLIAIVGGLALVSFLVGGPIRAVIGWGASAAFVLAAFANKGESPISTDKISNGAGGTAVLIAGLGFLVTLAIAGATKGKEA